jgi:hypothetical protein
VRSSGEQLDDVESRAADLAQVVPVESLAVIQMR